VIEECNRWQWRATVTKTATGTIAAAVTSSNSHRRPTQRRTTVTATASYTSDRRQQPVPPETYQWTTNETTNDKNVDNCSNDSHLRQQLKTATRDSNRKRHRRCTAIALKPRSHCPDATQLNKTVLSSWVASGDVITLKTQLNKTGYSRRVLNIFVQSAVLLSWVAKVFTLQDSSRLQQRLSVTVVT